MFNKKRGKLLQKIAEVEAQIDKEEELFEAVNLQLAESASNGHSLKVKALQIQSHQHQADMDNGYKTLETLINDLDILDKDKP